MSAGHWWLAALLAGPAAAWAAETPELPPLELVQKAVTQAPVVQAARSLLRAGEAERLRFEAGPHEWAVRAGTQQRRVRFAPEERFTEWDVGLERPLRLPAKTVIDYELGASSVRQSEVAYGDALHETSRGLLAAWFDWLRARETAAQWAAQQALLRRQAQSVSRRVELGDAPRLETLLAEGAAQQAEAQRTLAQARVEQAVADLRLRFPALALPESLTLPAPRRLEGELAYWRGEILQHSHELLVARGESARARLGASRADAERTPDPTVAMRMASERGGDQRIIGLSLMLPLPGQARRAQADIAASQSAAAAYREVGVLTKIEREASATYVAAQANFETWQRAAAAAQQLDQAAELTARAYELGEGSLADTLLARRQTNEAQLAARLAQLDELEARDRLLLDAHQLWVFEREHANERQPD